MKTGNFSSYISNVKRSLHFLLFTVRDFWDWKPFVWMLPLSFPRVRVVFVSWRRAHHEGLRSLFAIWSVEKNLHSAVIICFSPCFFFILHWFLYGVCHPVSSSCSVYLLLPCCCSLQNSKAFLKCRASLSVEPVSSSKPCWKLCCSVLLSFGSLISPNCSVHELLCVCVMWVYDCVQTNDAATISESFVEFNTKEHGGFKTCA